MLRGPTLLWLLLPVAAALLAVHYGNETIAVTRLQVDAVISYMLSICVKPILGRFFTISEREWNAVIQIEGMHSPVTIYRDQLGIPYIYAQNDEDLLFAQGYVTAMERHGQMLLMKLYGQGRLSEYAGEAFLPIDIEMRILGMNEVVKRALQHTDPDVIKTLSIYSKGVSKALENLPRKQIEFRLLRMPLNTTWSVEDCAMLQLLMGQQLNRGWSIEVSNVALKTELSGTFYKELMRQYDKRIPYINPEGPSAVFYDLNGNKISIPLSPPMDLLSMISENSSNMEKTSMNGVEDPTPNQEENPFTPPQIDGSNAWAVSGKYTKSKGAMIAGDMHLMQTAPGTFFPIFLFSNKSEIIRQSNDTIKMIGASLPGLPGLVAGHNEYIGASMTVSFADTDDLFEVELTEDGNSYWYDGKQLPLHIREEWIYIKEKMQVKRIAVKHTHHGPIITDLINERVKRMKKNHHLALSTPLYRAGCGIEGVRAFASKNWSQLFSSVAGKSCVELVATWADVYGNIGNFVVGGIPRRSNVGDNVLRDGSSSKDDWTGYLSTVETPHYMNPQRGYVFAANSLLTPDNSHRFGSCAVPGHRQWRIDAMLRRWLYGDVDTPPRTDLTVDDFAAMQHDKMSLNACEFKEVVINRILKTHINGNKICDGFKEEEEEFVGKLMEAANAWNCQVSPQAEASSFFEVYLHLALEYFMDRLPIDQAVKRELLGRIPKSRFLHELGVHIRPTFVRLLMMNESSQVMQSAGGTDAVLCEGLRQVMNVSSKLYSKLTPYMKWTDVQKLYFSHSFTANAPLLKDTLSVGPFSPGGNFGTIHATRSSFNDIIGKTAGARRTTVSAGPVIQMVMDAGDWSSSRWLVLPGTSGWVATKHYGDQLQLMKGGLHHKMLWEYNDIVESSVTRLLLIPLN